MTSAEHTHPTPDPLPESRPDTAGRRGALLPARSTLVEHHRAGPRPARRPPALAAAPTTAVLLRALGRRWLLASTLGLLCAAAVATALWLLLPPSNYSTRALLHVAAQPPTILFQTADQQRNDFHSYQRTQVVWVRSKLVLNAALRKPKVASLATIAEQVEPVEWLEKELQVDYSYGPETLRIALSGDRPEELAIIVNAVTDAYLEEVVTKEHRKRRARFEQLNEYYHKYDLALRDKRRTLKDLAEAAGSGDAHTLALKHRFALAQLAMAEQKLLQLKFDIQQATVDLGVQEQKEKLLDDQTPGPDVLDAALRQDRVVDQYLHRLADLDAAIQETLRVAVRGEEEPKVVALRKEQKSVQEALDARRQSPTGSRPRSARESRRTATNSWSGSPPSKDWRSGSRRRSSGWPRKRGRSTSPRSTSSRSGRRSRRPRRSPRRSAPRSSSSRLSWTPRRG
jgi:hypothetical protein